MGLFENEFCVDEVNTANRSEKLIGADNVVENEEDDDGEIEMPTGRTPTGIFQVNVNTG